MTAETVAEKDVVLCVGDTTFLDYGSIEAKKEGYGPIAKGGNGREQRDFVRSCKKPAFTQCAAGIAKNLI